MIQEFKEFVMRGNILDLAVAVVLGAAFGKIVTSFVSDVLMPPIGMLMGGVNFSDLKYVIQDAKEGVEAVTLNYGVFIQNIIDFLLVALAIFMVVKVYNRAVKKQEEVADPPAQEVLLTEIRDLLKK